MWEFRYLHQALGYASVVARWLSDRHPLGNEGMVGGGWGEAEGGLGLGGRILREGELSQSSPSLSQVQAAGRHEGPGRHCRLRTSAVLAYY